MPIVTGARSGVQAEADSPFLSGAGCFRVRALPCPSYGLHLVRPSDGVRRSRHREFLVRQISDKRGSNEALFTPGQDEKILKNYKTEHPTVAFYDSFRTFEVTFAGNGALALLLQKSGKLMSTAKHR